VNRENEYAKVSAKNEIDQKHQKRSLLVLKINTNFGQPLAVRPENRGTDVVKVTNDLSTIINAHNKCIKPYNSQSQTLAASFS